MSGSPSGAVSSPTGPPGTDTPPTTESDDPFIRRPGRAGQQSDDGGAEPLTERAAEALVHGICFKTGPPARVGVELEWLVCDSRSPTLPVDQQRAATAVAPLSTAGALPGRGVLTTEPGGQVELSSAPAAGLGQCITVTSLDLAALRHAIHQAG